MTTNPLNKENRENKPGCGKVEISEQNPEPKPPPVNPTNPPEIPDPSKRQEVPVPPHTPEIGQVPEPEPDTEDRNKTYKPVYGYSKHEDGRSYPGAESVVFKKNRKRILA